MTNADFSTTLSEQLNHTRPKVAVVQELLMHAPQQLSDDAYNGIFILLETVREELSKMEQTIAIHNDY